MQLLISLSSLIWIYLIFRSKICSCLAGNYKTKGRSTLPISRIVPVKQSQMKYKNGWSTSKNLCLRIPTLLVSPLPCTPHSSISISALKQKTYNLFKTNYSARRCPWNFKNVTFMQPMSPYRVLIDFPKKNHSIWTIR